MAEIHTCLAYNIRQVPGQRNTASTSLYEASHEHDGLDDGLKTTTEELLNALATRGGNWERAPLRNTPDREGWQDAIIGLLKDVGQSNRAYDCETDTTSSTPLPVIFLAYVMSWWTCSSIRR
jgi:hypothetical protein